MFYKTAILVFFLFLYTNLAGVSHSLMASENKVFDPVGILLTWQQDPTTTMTLDWHTLPGDEDRRILEYRKKEGQWNQWSRVTAESFAFPFSNRTIHRVELTGLLPGTEYVFRFGDNSKSYRFCTMPGDNIHEPVRIAIGGDVYREYEFTERITALAASYEPNFVVFGGDLAYANSDPRRVENWFEFFEIMKNNLVIDKNRLVPIVVAVGNHEVFSHHRLDNQDLPYYYGSKHWGIDHGSSVFFDAIFAYPGDPGYGVLDFGAYFSLLTLDTGHLNPIDGKQTEWLEKVLMAREKVPQIFPVYHVGAYPTARPYDGGTAIAIRQNWSPLFEQFGVSVAFEHHDHIYKRTHPMKNEKTSYSDGVVYLGDGPWGSRVRLDALGQHHDGPVWYLKRATPQHHFILATLQGGHRHFLMINSYGDVIDEYPRTPHTEINQATEADIIAPVLDE